MKKILFNPKPLSKAERVYLKAQQNRPSSLILNDIYSKVQNHIIKPVEERALPINYDKTSKAD